jgi:hypothetical protein
LYNGVRLSDHSSSRLSKADATQVGALADAEAVVVAIYIDSWVFVFATAIIQFAFGVDFSFPVCDSAILLCLLCYVSSKVCCETLLYVRCLVWLFTNRYIDRKLLDIISFHPRRLD